MTIQTKHESISSTGRQTEAAYPTGLRITHIVSSLKVGGMEHFVLRIAAAQQAFGHHVSVIALQDGVLRAEARRLRLPCFVLGGRSKHLRAVRGASMFAFLRPAIAHVHNQTSLHYAVLAKRVSGARVVMTNHGQGNGVSRTPSEREWNSADAIVAVSNAVADSMTRRTLGNRLSTIYNGVTVSPARSSRSEVRQKLGIGANRIVGTIVARIDALKGHDTLLHALAQFGDSNGPVTLLIVGDGAERANREVLARHLGLTDNAVQFLGFRDDVPDLLAASDFFTLPSLTEGLPLSVLEAMSHRLPIVATQVGGIPELVADGVHGLLVPANDADALSGAIATLVRCSVMRRKFGDAGYQRVLTEFSFEKMTCEYDALYRRLVQPPVNCKK